MERILTEMLVMLTQVMYRKCVGKVADWSGVVVDYKYDTYSMCKGYLLYEVG